MTPSLTKGERLLESVEKLSNVGPPGVSFRYGVSLDVLREDEPFSGEEELDALSKEQAIAIHRRRWLEWNIDKVQESVGAELAMEVFVFATIFGVDKAAYLAEQAVHIPEVGKDYVMKEPPAGWEITTRSAEQMSKSGHKPKLLSNFRMLTSGYIGWLHRVRKPTDRTK